MVVAGLSLRPVALLLDMLSRTIQLLYHFLSNNLLTVIQTVVDVKVVSWTMLSPMPCQILLSLELITHIQREKPIANIQLPKELVQSYLTLMSQLMT